MSPDNPIDPSILEEAASIVQQAASAATELAEEATEALSPVVENALRMASMMTEEYGRTVNEQVAARGQEQSQSVETEFDQLANTFADRVERGGEGVNRGLGGGGEGRGVV